jgi:hypothetical protein
MELQAAHEHRVGGDCAQCGNGPGMSTLRTEFPCRSRRTYVLALPLLLFLISVSCAHIGTVRNEISNTEFLLVNFPVRAIRVLVFSDGSFSGKELKDFLEHGVSPAIEEQVGIRLKVAGTVFTKWTDSNTSGIIQQMYSSAKDYRSFDLCIAFT